MAEVTRRDKGADCSGERGSPATGIDSLEDINAQLDRAGLEEEPMQQVSTQPLVPEWWEQCLAGIAVSCRDAIVAKLRHISQAKLDYIINVVEDATKAASAEIRERDQSCTSERDKQPNRDGSAQLQGMSREQWARIPREQRWCTDGPEVGLAATISRCVDQVLPRAQHGDSYHLLAELDRQEGDAYKAVKRAALRLERAQQARSARRDGLESESRRATKEHDLAQKETAAKKCFNCGEVGHLAAGCPKPKKNGDRPTKHKPSLGRERRTTPKPKAGSFSAYVKGWCGEVREDVAGNETDAYGEPCLCDVTVMGIKAKAMIDTGSIISILPLGLLRQALKSGSPLDEMVTMLGAGNDRKVFDALGNEMRFLMLVATHVDVHGGVADVQTVVM
ncbi:zinc knuckle [Oesophagostomum dentatum]|uniref:Zinc knuckle n=1 Tax=Oesophagostomum dentatum TaxID=61180 RepID=A0A0B1TRU3_OESDE|nr:zinc knuckle [Oesophagostomum dentatum]